MRRRVWVIAALALTSLPGAVVVFTPAGTATAGCVGVGRRVYVSGCADPAPPPAYYAPLPEDVPPPPPPVNTCVGYNGRWVHANNCN
ncbi:hypothetical protein [Mycolicibacter icosiumassiliensis]|uniref:hypothetical protein n=1 Tax=Mycolicibacter icosiumassiliensis TaxID=1792835 RepID=UPI00083510E4|nr:hypothetical protein [Mycolicibacter icosiumassiliensis]